MALPKSVEKLVQDVFAQRGEHKRMEAQKDPEACLVSLLLAIRADLPVAGITLSHTVQGATFRSNIYEAREYLGQATVAK